LERVEGKVFLFGKTTKADEFCGDCSSG